MSSNAPQLFIIYELGDQPLLDYTIQQFKDADPFLVIKYNIQDAGTDNFVAINEADCVLVLWTPNAFDKVTASKKKSKVKIEKPKLLKEVQACKSKQNKVIVASWYRPDIEPLSEVAAATFVRVENSFAPVVEEVTGILPSRTPTGSVPTRSYTPLDLLTFNLTSWALEALAEYFRVAIGEAINSALEDQAGSAMDTPGATGDSDLDAIEIIGPRASLFWIHEAQGASPAYMYLVAVDGDFSLNERRLKIEFGQVGAGELWAGWSPAKPQFTVFYPNFAAAKIETLAPEVQEIVKSIGPLLVLPVTRGAKLVGCVCVDCKFPGGWQNHLPASFNDQVTAELETLITDYFNGELSLENTGKKKPLAELIPTLAEQIPDRPLSFRHYLNIKRILDVARLFPELELPVRASYFHLNDKADRIADRYDLADAAAEVTKAHVHMAIVSPTLEDDDASLANIERIANGSYARGVGLVGKVWEHHLAFDADRSGKSIADLIAEYQFTEAQAANIQQIKSILALPVEGLGANPAERGEVVGVLSITSTRGMSETRLRAYLEEYWNLVRLIERILTASPI